MATFNLVPSGISKYISKMDYRAFYNISKMSKNSPRSFMVRENRKFENGKLSLLSMAFYTLAQVANQFVSCLYLFYRS